MIISILPAVLKASTLASLGLHPTSSEWDRQTVGMVESLRAIYYDPEKINQQTTERHKQRSNCQGQDLGCEDDRAEADRAEPHRYDLLGYRRPG